MSNYLTMYNDSISFDESEREVEVNRKNGVVYETSCGVCNPIETGGILSTRIK